jgi:predicted nucleic acid-binding protein
LIVVDASLIVALILREDNVADPASVYKFLRTAQVSVPAHWPAEVATALGRTNDAAGSQRKW